MNRDLDGKKVRFLAVDKKYIKVPYPCIAPMSQSLNTYITGQHIEPEDETTYDNLSIEEMTGQTDLTIKKRKRFPHVINPDQTVNIFHGKVYDCTLKEGGTPKNPKQYAEAYFILAQDWLVASDKSSARPSVHKFHLDDKDADSKKRVLLSDARFEAEKLIREKAALEDYKVIIFMLNMRLPGFYEEPDGMSESRIKDILLKQAEENPAQIKYYFSEEAQPFIFGAKLYANGIMEKRHDGYYYNGVFLAEDGNALSKYLKDEANTKMIEKLRRELHVEA